MASLGLFSFFLGSRSLQILAIALLLSASVTIFRAKRSSQFLSFSPLTSHSDHETNEPKFFPSFPSFSSQLHVLLLLLLLTSSFHFPRMSKKSLLHPRSYTHIRTYILLQSSLFHISLVSISPLLSTSLGLIGGGGGGPWPEAEDLLERKLFPIEQTKSESRKLLI